MSAESVSDVSFRRMRGLRQDNHPDSTSFRIQLEAADITQIFNLVSGYYEWPSQTNEIETHGPGSFGPSKFLSEAHQVSTLPYSGLNGTMT
jgi:hypothetical protein